MSVLRLRHLGAILLLLALQSAACRGSPAPTAAFSVRDSGNVTIAENGLSPDSSFAVWSLGSRPIVRIGDGSGQGTTSLNAVSGGVVNDAGELVIADDGNTLRRFAPQGELLDSGGREGSGPGEYERISLLGHYRSDSLFIWDFPLRRLSILSDNGAYVRSLNGPPGFFFAVGALHAGDIIGLEARGLSLQGLPPGPVPTPTNLISLHVATGRVDTIATFSGTDSYLTHGPPAQVVSIPFSSSPVATVGDTLIFVASGPAYEIRGFDAYGKVRSIIRWMVPPRPLRKETREAFVQHLLDRARSDRAKADIDRIYHEVTFPEALPAISQLMVDPHQNLWVGSFTEAGDDSTHWSIFSPTGRRFAALSTPSSFQLLDVSEERVLGVSRDSLGIEWVQVLQIRRAGTSAAQ